MKPGNRLRLSFAELRGGEVVPAERPCGARHLTAWASGRVLFSGLLGIWLSGATPGLGALIAAEQSPPSDVAQWVRQLGAAEYSLRQEAARRLLEEGEPARHSLERALQGHDPEVRERASQLLELIRRSRYERLLDQLISDPESPPPEGLPAWDRYVVVVGDSLAARLFYRDLLQAEPDLLWMLDRDRPALQQELQHRAEGLQSMLQRDRSGLGSTGCSRECLAALLLVSVDPDVPTHPALTSLLELVTDLGPLSQATDDNDASAEEPIRKLLGAWVQVSPGSRSRRMNIAIRFDLPEGIHPALEAAADPRAPTVDRQLGILLIARFGGVEHIPDLEPLLANSTEVDTQRQRQAVTFQSRLQDFALVSMLYLTGQEPVEYGFGLIEESSQYVYNPRTIGFSNDLERQAAIRKWQSWRALNLRSPLFEPFDAVEGVTL